MGRNLTDKKIIIATIVVLTGFALVIYSYWIQQYPYFFTLLMNGAFLLIALGLGIVIINYYFEYQMRRKVMINFFTILGPTLKLALEEFHEIIFYEYGKNGFRELVEIFNEEDEVGIKGFSKDDRDKIYSIIEKDYEKFKDRFSILCEDMTHLTSVWGVSISETDLLLEVLKCQSCMKSFPRYRRDGSENDKIISNFLNSIIISQNIHNIMADLRDKYSLQNKIPNWELPSHKHIDKPSTVH